MDDQFWIAARRFGDVPRRLNLYGLWVALFLEFFAWPILRFLPYMPLRKRRLLPDLATEFRGWVLAHVPEAILPIDDPPTGSDEQVLLAWVIANFHGEQADLFLELIGKGLQVRLTQRHKEMHHANVVAILALLSGLLAHLFVVIGIAMSGLFSLLAPWIDAMLFATIICVSDRHWRPRRDFR